MWNDLEPRFGGSEQYSSLFQSRSARGAATGLSRTRPSMMAQVPAKILDEAGACQACLACPRYSGWGIGLVFTLGPILYTCCRSRQSKFICKRFVTDAASLCTPPLVLQSNSSPFHPRSCLARQQRGAAAPAVPQRRSHASLAASPSSRGDPIQPGPQNSLLRSPGSGLHGQ